MSPPRVPWGTRLPCLGPRAPADPDETADGEQDTHHARELGDAERPEPGAVEPQRLDAQTSHRVKPDIPEEQPARPIVPARSQPPREHRKHAEIPQRFVEEGRHVCGARVVAETALA